jgi:Na+-driven multidrug efflux pump
MQRVDQFAQMPGGSMGTAAGVLAGQNLGAGRPDRAARTGWLAVLMATGVSVLLCLIFWFWADRIFGIYSRDSELVSLSSTFLRINIASYLFWGVVVALSMCLNGLGDTMVPMITNLVTMVGIQLGLAYYLSRYTSLGMYGVRWAAAAGIVARAFIYTSYFKAGRWKRTRV